MRIHPFSAQLIAWYLDNGRTLPWRETSDPYCIWLSEVLLQQTQVKQGLGYYVRFLQRFPDVFSLAAASEDEVMSLWQGLGYYSRARNFHKAAKIIASAGAFPSNYDDLRRLPGVGDYTAAAVASFAFGELRAAVDGNAYRVLSRYFGLNEPIDTIRGKNTFAKFANELLIEPSARFNSAMMDFGATQCVPRNPDCGVCPLSASCVALAEGNVATYPVKKRQLQRKVRRFTYLYVRTATHLVLRKRSARDVWQGLYEPFLFENDGMSNSDEKDLSSALSALMENMSGGNALPDFVREVRPLFVGKKHDLTHQRILVSAYEVMVDELVPFEDYFLCNLSEREDFPHSRLVSAIYEAVDLAEEI